MICPLCRSKHYYFSIVREKDCSMSYSLFHNIIILFFYVNLVAFFTPRVYCFYSYTIEFICAHNLTLNTERTSGYSSFPPWRRYRASSTLHTTSVGQLGRPWSWRALQCSVGSPCLSASACLAFSVSPTQDSTAHYHQYIIASSTAQYSLSTFTSSPFSDSTMTLLAA